MKNYLCLVVLLFFALTGHAQDIHFSDFYASPLNMNPALAGLFRGDFRVNALYRDQYRTVAVPYQTVAMGVDAAQSHIFKTKNTLGYGIQTNIDVAGDAHFGTYQMTIPLAIHHKTYAEKFTYSAGAGISIVHNALDISELTFPEQFDGDQYSEYIEISEDLENTSITYLNLSLGINGIFKPYDRQTYTLGMSLNNINRPDYSFSEDDESRLKRRLLIHALARKDISENIDIIPSLKMQLQGSQQEYQFGVVFYQYLNNINISAINYGLWFRSKDKDAVVLNIGFNISDIQTSISYDINVSSLSTASGGHGAFEIALVYIYRKNSQRRKFKSIKCPSYL